MISARKRIIAVFILVVLSVAAISAAFEQITVVPILTKPLNGHGILPLFPGEDEGAIDLNLMRLGDEPTDYSPLFTVYSAGDSPYLKARVFVDYDRGAWTSNETQGVQYSGGMIDVTKSSLSSKSDATMQIAPIQSLPFLLPVPKEVTSLTSVHSFDLNYIEEHGTFENPNGFNYTYSVQYLVQTFKESLLRQVNASQDARYLQVPDDILGQIRELAEFVTKDASTAIDKALAIEGFLQGNYQYKTGTGPAPAGVDPTIWFLFSSKQGSCSHFNTALALMARSIGIPARMISGYLIFPSLSYQTVSAMNGHAYVEMEFDGVGWLTFDATYAAGHDWYEPEDIGPITPIARYNNSVYGTVYLDLNGNGVVDNREQPVYGVTVFLTLADRPVETTWSGTYWAGGFRFSELVPGAYALQIAPQPNFESTGPSFINLTIESNQTIEGLQFTVNYHAQIEGMYDTLTNLFLVDTITRKGAEFAVRGTITNSTGDPVSGMTVQIFLAQTKESERTLCGEGQENNGSFLIICTAPKSLGVGSYQIIARALGNELFKSSESDPNITFFDDTEMSMSVDRRLAAGAPTLVTVQLSTESDNQPVYSEYVHINTGVDDLGTYIYQGQGQQEIRLWTPGAHVVSATFNGSTFLNGSEVSQEVEVLPVTLDCMSTNLIRGEQNVLIGRAHASELGVGYQAVQLAIGQGLTTDTISDRNGYFALSFNASADWPLGSTSRTIQLGDFATDVSTINITARPQMRAFADGLSLEVQVVDDHHTPLPGQSISCRGPGFVRQAVTDANGTAVFSPSPEEEFNYTFTFAGNQVYEAASATLFYTPPSTDIGSIPLYGALICIPVAGTVLYLRHRRRTGKQSPRPAPKKVYPYYAAFPEIAEGLPGVWHEGEPLKISVGGAFQEVSVRLDGESAIKVRKGDSPLVRSLSKGSHGLRISGQAGDFEEEVRIVEYKEEVARLFRESVAKMKSIDPNLSDDMAPREIEASMLAALPPGKENALDEMVTLFEYADYSLHSIGRREYERMYRAVAEVCV
jgi:hypothetical protein